MAQSFMARRLGEVVAGTGNDCPRPADIAPHAAIHLSLILDTDESGFVVTAIAVDYVDVGGGLLKRWALCHYPAGAEDACRTDGRILSRLWNLPLRRATGHRGWEPDAGNWDPVY